MLRDLGDTNGTYVNGARLRGLCRLVQGNRIDVGPFQLTFDGSALTKEGRVGNVELLVRGVSYDVPRRDTRRVPRRILRGANLHILPSELVAIIGANGSGKSTLMNIMVGRALPSEGTVLLNGADLHASFQVLKQDIAFAPQQDVLHEQLTLRQALDYTARLRLSVGHEVRSFRSLGATVTTFAYMNRYTVTSDYGPLRRAQYTRLRRLVREPCRSPVRSECWSRRATSSNRMSARRGCNLARLCARPAPPSRQGRSRPGNSRILLLTVEPMEPW